jgi:uncharacterized protein with FMN-binding domain
MKIKAQFTTAAWFTASVAITVYSTPGLAAPLAQNSAANTESTINTEGKTVTYADGTYTATGQYGNAPSYITVTVTLSGGLIVSAKVTTRATNPISLYYQERFATAVPEVVVGKPIDQVNVGRLAGSSGTPSGFNAAIAQIRQQAASRGTVQGDPK